MAETEALENMRKLIGGIRTLPTLPVIIARLTKMLADPETSVRKVTGLLAEDQALTAKILKLANSAYYGFPGQIASVDHAVVMLGFGGVRDVALSASVIELFRGSPAQAEEMKRLFVPARFWEHSIAAGVACRMLARSRKLADPEEAFVAGLLHDIGKLIMYEHMPVMFLEILQDCRDRARPFVAAEAERDCSHAALGRLLVEEWKLPERISEPVGFHHRLRPRRPTAAVTAAVQFADVFARARGVGWAGDEYLPGLEPETTRMLALDEMDFGKFIEEFDAQMLQASVFMELAAGGAKK
jgi:putative nucleotidyltransferase with HDIG domain